MSKMTSLIVLLLVQGVLIFWLYSENVISNREQQTEQALMELDTRQVNSVIITNEKNKTVVLKKTDNGWILPDYYQLAVDQGLLEQLLEKAVATKTIWPIASSKGAAKRFLVSSTDFKRHVSFGTTDNKTVDLFLGNSPGLRKIYARNANNTDIYAVEFGLYLVPPEPERWFDKRLLKVRKSIKKIQGADFLINKEGDNWVLDQVQDNQSVEQTKIDSLANALVYPQVKAVANMDMLKQLKGKQADVHYKVITDGDAISYDFYRLKDDVILKSSLSELHFVIPVYVVENLLGISRRSFIINNKKTSLPENGGSS